MKTNYTCILPSNDFRTHRHPKREREREREREQEESIKKEDMGPNRARRPILAELTPRERRPIPQAE